MNFNAIDTHAHIYDVAFDTNAPSPPLASANPMLRLFEMAGYEYFIEGPGFISGLMETLLRGSIHASMARSQPRDLHDSMARANVRISVVLPVHPHVSTERVYSACDFKTLFPFCSPPVDSGLEGCMADASLNLERGCAGIKIHPIIQKRRLTDPIYIELFKLCAEFGVPLLTHVGGTGRMFGIDCPGIEMSDIRRLASSCKSGTLIAAHCGLWQHEELLLSVKSLPNVFVDTSFQSRRVIKRMVDLIGDERIFLGSDFPIGSQRLCVENVLGADIKPESKTRILHRNSIAVFRFREKFERFLKCEIKPKE